MAAVAVEGRTTLSNGAGKAQLRSGKRERGWDGAARQRSAGPSFSTTISRPRATRLFTVPILQLQMRALSS